MDGGVGYTNHPTSCDRFVVCYPTDGGNVKPVTQLCPYGLFWSQTALTCRLTKDVYCPHGTSTFYLTMHIKRHIINSYIFIQYVIYNTATVRTMIEHSSVCSERRDLH
jgi:hypothetical protein